MDFITTDSQLILEGTTLNQKRIRPVNFSANFMGAYFVVFFFNSVYDKLKTLTINSSRYDKTYLGLVGFVILLYIGFFIFKIFKEHWRNKVDILKIVNIKTFPDEGGLETNVMLKFKSGRFKTYSFRTLEKQAEKFIEAIRSMRPALQVVYS